jgi:hypothetical protein
VLDHDDRDPLLAHEPANDAEQLLAHGRRQPDRRLVEKQQGRRTSEPLMMQPPDTIESVAMPRRPSSSKTNFAGGSCSW